MRRTARQRRPAEAATLTRKHHSQQHQHTQHNTFTIMTQTERKQLTPHFKLYEFTRSGVAADHDLPNCPNAAQTAALEALCQNVLEPLRHRFGPIVISSGFRSPAVNRLIPGAAPASQHTKGEAADIVVGTPERATALYRFIRDHLDFDQLIWEPIDAPVPRWIHVSYTRRRKNRHSVL